MRVVTWILGYLFITNYLPYLGVELGSKEAELCLFKMIGTYAFILDIIEAIKRR